jgi:HK97 family phage prohead protease
VEHKTLSLNNCEIKLSQDSGLFQGYASTFNNVDSYGDTILAGAYKSTLANNGMPKMFILHKSYELPIGKWLDAGEDSKGLYVKGELTPNMSMSNDVHAALKHGTLDGLSIGYMLKKSDYAPSYKVEGGRTIKNVSNLIDISPVTFPADSFSRIDLISVKSEIETIESIKDFERYLREAGNFNRDMCKMLIAQAKIIFGQRDADNVVDAKALTALKQRLEKFALPS